MIVSLSWLEDYVSIQMDVSSLADALTMVGLEVEAIWDRYDYLNSVVVGELIWSPLIQKLINSPFVR
jgi:phenylalanyl-tRNA synthetase beta chain